MTIPRPGRLTLATLSLTAIGLSPAFSQDGGGIRGVLTFSQGLELSDNPDLLVGGEETEIRSVTGLGLSLGSETRTQQLRFTANTQIEGAFGSDTTADDTLSADFYRLGLNYGRQGANSALSFSANLSESQLQDDVFGFFVDGAFDPDALIIDGGERRTTSMRLTLETGIQAPLGFTLSASTSSTDYDGTTDPDLFDRDSQSLDATARLRINPALDGKILAGVSRRDDFGAVTSNRENTYFGAGVSGELGSGLSFSSDIRFDKSETRELGSVVDEDDGIGLTFDATQDRPDGSIGLSLSSRVDESGRRTTASVNRTYDLPNGGLTLSLGIADQEDEDMELTTRVTYERELADARLKADIVQSPSTRDGDALLNTSIRLNYEQEINSVSSWDAGFSYGASSAFGASDGDTRTSASVAYRRDLTADWGMRAGVEVIRIEDDGGSDRNSNTIFFTVDRDFSFGF